MRWLINCSLLQVHSGVTFVQTEPDEDWRPPAAVCISTEHEWRLAGRAFKEQVGAPVCRSGRAEICATGLLMVSSVHIPAAMHLQAVTVLRVGSQSVCDIFTL